MYTSDNFHPNLKSFPNHIALIPDGGRRWAEKHGRTYIESYSNSMQIVLEIIDYIFKKGTEYFSIFFASTSNFKRTSQEVFDFCTAEWDFLNNIFLSYAINNDIRIKIVGTYNADLKPFEKSIENIEKETEKGNKTVYFCFNYNSIDEIDMAVKKSSETGESFVNYLQIPHPVDILIRTGNANVLSGFLLPQIASARIFFFEKLFNDFTLRELKKTINDYLSYDLKYGE